MIKKFHPKSFKDAKITVPYVTYNYVSKDIRYKLFNNQIEIDLKSIIDKVLDHANVTGFDTSQIKFSIPYDINDAASGDTFNLLIDKKRFHIRLPEVQIVSNKQQKIDWDNTHPVRWTVSQWVKFLEKLWWDYYGFNSVELDLRGGNGAVRRGKLITRIKGLYSKLRDLGLNADAVVQYIVWVFSNKAKKVTLNIPLMCCDGYIQEWMVWRRRQNGEKKGLSDKWK